MTALAATAPAPRTPQRFANYRGDQSHAVGEVMGPNRLGEHLVVVTAEYDDKADKTRLGFAYPSRTDLDRYVAQIRTAV